MALPVHGRGPGYRRDIDGLRAVAVCSVLGFHALPDAIPGGFAGVDVFFVLSGYLISGILWNALDEGTFSLRAFYARRIRRIFPALALVLAACLVLGWFTLLPLEYARLGKHTLAGAAFASNFVLYGESGYFDKAAELKPLLHLWSLAIEEQFYLVWPLLLFAARRLRLSLVGVAVPVLVVSFALNVITVSGNADAAFYSPWTRVWELAIGALMVGASASMVSPFVRHLASFSGALAVSGSMFVLSRLNPVPGWGATLPTIGTCLLLLAGPQAWLNQTVLSSRPFVFVGLISYPLYLWHWPLLSFARLVSLETPPLETRILLLALAVIAAYATYKLVERPIRAGRGGKRVVVGLACAIATLAALGLAVFAAHGFPFRIAPPLRQYVSYEYDLNADVNNACWLSLTDAAHYPDSCLDDGKPGPAVFVWGDSHAARLSAGMRRVLGKDARMAQYTRSGCPPILGYGSEACRAANAIALRKVRESKPEVVVLFASWLQHGQTWRTLDVAVLLEQTLRDVMLAGAGRIVVIGPAPYWRADLPWLLAKATFRDVPRHRVPLRMKFGLEPAGPRVDGALETLASKVPGVTYVSALKLLCDDEGCLTRVDEEPDGLTTWDYGHLTTKGAVYLVLAMKATHPQALPPFE